MRRVRATGLSFALALALSACVPSAPPITAPGDAGLKDRGTSGADAAEEMDSGVDPADAGPSDDGVHPDAALPDAAPEADSDGDGLPDSADPNEGYSNPNLFEDSFESTSSGWIFSSVSMEISPGASLLHVFVVEPYEREGWIGPRATWGDYLVRTLIRVNEVGAGSEIDSGYVAVMARVGQVTPSRYVACGINLKTAKVQLIEYEGTDRSVIAEVPTSAARGEWLAVEFNADGNLYRCNVGGVEATGSSPTFFSGAVGFRSFDATFDADWIQVFELQL